LVPSEISHIQIYYFPIAEGQKKIVSPKIRFKKHYFRI